MLTAGEKAPEFKLPDQDGNVITSDDFKGKWFLLYFYPKDFTSGCTTEACTLRDNFRKLNEKAEIVGVSADGIESHKKFSEKYNLPYTLLSDTGRKTIRDYGANGLIFTKRVSFLINPQGIIQKIYNRVDPKTHASKILEDLQNIN